MKIILAPAKQMKTADDDFSWRDLPVYLEKTEILMKKMKQMDDRQLKAMWRCSEPIVWQNVERLEDMDLRGRLSPAVFSYDGLAYKHLSVGAMTWDQLEYLQSHLRILSGFYGILKPFDGITPYRLEMQTVMPDIGDLYTFWGDLLYRELIDDDHLIINLASKEYSKVVEPYLTDKDRMITMVFEKTAGKPGLGSAIIKVARGEFTYWMAENNITDPEDLKSFNVGFTYQEERSDDTHFVFTENKKA